MRASDIAKLAESVAAGYITEEAAFALLSEDGDVLLLSRILDGDTTAASNAAKDH